METKDTRAKPSNAYAGEPRNPNQINVSNKKNANFYVFLGKKLLQENDTIELHALGNAISTSVIAAENLVRYFSTFIYFIFIETSMLSSRKSKLRPSQLRETEETQREPNSSSLLRSIQTSKRTWRNSMKSKKKTKRMLRPRKRASEVRWFQLQYG